MSVHVRAVLRDGSLSRSNNRGCFGFINSHASTMDVLALANITYLKEILYHMPNLFRDASGEAPLPEDERAMRAIVIQKYFNALHDAGVSRFIQKKRITIKQIMDEEQGIRLDATKYPGQFIVGIFEMYRNAQYHYEYVKDVVTLVEKGHKPMIAIILARTLYLKEALNAERPYADCIMSGVLYKKLAHFMEDASLAEGFKLYPHNFVEKEGYLGVFKLFTAFCKGTSPPLETIAKYKNNIHSNKGGGDLNPYSFHRHSRIDYNTWCEKLTPAKREYSGIVEEKVIAYITTGTNL